MLCASKYAKEDNSILTDKSTYDKLHSAWTVHEYQTVKVSLL